MKSVATDFPRWTNKAFRWLKQYRFELTLLLGFILLVVQHGLVAGRLKSLEQSVVGLESSGQDAVLECMNRAHEAENKQDYPSAQMYLLNAATRAPRDMTVLNRYTTLVCDKRANEEGDLERLVSILQLAAYQVAPQDLSKLLKLVAQAEQSLKQLRLPSGRTREYAGSLAEEVERLEKAEPKTDSPNELAEYVANLRFLAERTSAAADMDLDGRVKRQVERWALIEEISKSASYMDTCLSELESMQAANELNTDRAVAVVQAAEQTLPTFWAISTEQTPPALAKKLSKYPTEVQKLVKAISDSRSQPALTKIKQLKAGALTLPTGTWAAKIRHVEQKLEQAQHELTEIKSPEILKLAQNNVEEISKGLNKCRREQFNAYQRHVLERCQKAFGGFNSEWYISESDALKYFNENELYLVDHALLAPEVSRCLNDVLQRLFARMTPAKLVDCERKMGEPDGKLKLENF